MSEFVIDTVKKYAASLLPSMGLELFDVQFRQEDRGWVLRIYIDSEEGVSLDHCTEVSREIGAYLEVEDIIEHAYHLEISSPGLERPLRHVEDFRKYQGEYAKVKLHYPVKEQKVFVGVIDKVVDNGEISFAADEYGKLVFTMDDVNSARLFLK